MAGVWLVVRAGLRARWRSWLALAVVAGLAGGLVTAVAAGARRADTAYPALVAWSAPPDLLVTQNPASTFASVTVPELRKLPEVAGIPFGIVGGRLAWLALCGQLGLQPAPVLAPVPLAVLAAAGILLSVAFAAIPGTAARRARPATVLRTE